MEGSDLHDELTIKMFCDGIRNELEEEVRQQWKIKTDGVGPPAPQLESRVERGQSTASLWKRQRRLSAFST